MMSMNAMGGGTNTPTMMGGKIYAAGGGPALTKEQIINFLMNFCSRGINLVSCGTVYGGKVVAELAQGKMTIAQVLQMMDTGMHPTTGEKLFPSDQYNSDAAGNR